MSDNVFKLAKALKDLENLRNKVLEHSKQILTEVRKSAPFDLTPYIELVQKLDDTTKSEGARAIGHLALTIALDSYKMVKELRDEQKEMRKRMEEIYESSVRSKSNTVSTTERAE